MQTCLPPAVGRTSAARFLPARSGCGGPEVALVAAARRSQSSPGAGCTSRFLPLRSWPGPAGPERALQRPRPRTGWAGTEAVRSPGPSLRVSASLRGAGPAAVSAGRSCLRTPDHRRRSRAAAPAPAPPRALARPGSGVSRCSGRSRPALGANGVGAEGRNRQATIQSPLRASDSGMARQGTASAPPRPGIQAPAGASAAGCAARQAPGQRERDSVTHRRSRGRRARGSWSTPRRRRAGRKAAGSGTCRSAASRVPAAGGAAASPSAPCREHC